MAAEVFRSNKQQEDPLDKVVKLTSIGVGVAGLASKGGGARTASDDLKTGPPQAMSDTNYGDAMSRRLGKLKTSYA